MGRPEGQARSKADPTAIVTGLIGALAAVVGIVFGFMGQHQAHDALVTSAHTTIVSDTLQMATYDQESGAGAESEITLLGAEADELVDKYGVDQLQLSPTTYRLIGQFLTYSTSDLATAQKMLDTAGKLASDTSLEQLWVYRLLGDVAAQRQQPDAMEAAYDKALAMSKSIPDPYPALDVYTRIYRLLDAYLGADRAVDEATRADFCALASKWSGDLHLVTDWAGRPHVHTQVARTGATSADQLTEICARPASA